jgi:hypothetical protein
MSGYAASARIVRASPRVVARGSLERPVDRRPTELAAVVVEGGVALGPPPRISVAERWLRFRDRWDQLTFFVTDPDSWR